MLIPRLESKRQQLGLTQEQWASQFGVTQSNWSQIVSGAIRVSSEMMGKISALFPGEFDLDILDYLKNGRCG